jgi:hypothetical protein
VRVIAYYKNCTIVKNEQEGFLITTFNGSKIRIVDAASIFQCKRWIDRQYTLKAIEQVFNLSR